MQTLCMLGSITLTSADGTEVDAILRQPKSVALLAYLALPRPGAWYRRDMLLATFWPELSQSAARAALRSALHLLRRHLAEGTIRTRGADDVGVDPALLATDAGAMLDDVERGDLTRALDRYRGELLPGLYITDAPGFERWLEAERARLSASAFRTATSLADAHRHAGELQLAIAAAARAAELSPYDESAARRLIALLGRTGDRARALAVYEWFRQRVASEFGTDPSPETVALVEEIRRRTTSQRPGGVPSAEIVLEPPATDVDASVVRPPERDEAPEPSSVARSSARFDRRPVAAMLAAASIAIVVISVLIASSRESTASVWQAGTAMSASRQLVLLPIEGNASDSANGYLAPGIEYGLTRRLEHVGALRVRHGTRTQARIANTIDAETPLTGTVLLRVRLDTSSDFVLVRASLIDSASRREREVLARRLPLSELPDVESRVASAVAGALHRVGVPFAVRNDDHPVDPEAYRLTILGYHQLITLGYDTLALATFMRATDIDPLYARAWAGRASVWGLRTGQSVVPLDEGYDLTVAAASRALTLDSMQGSALASLGLVTTLKYRRFGPAASFFRRAMANEPSNPEVFIIAATTTRFMHRWDDARDLVRVARQLDPLSSRYPANEAGVELCAGRPQAAVRVYREAMDIEPDNAEVRDGLVRALALQGKYDDALDFWRSGMTGKAPPALVAALTNARGRSGYYQARHVEGRQRLESYRQKMAGRTMPRLRLFQHQLRAGDSTAGFASLDTAAREGAEWLFRLPCFQSLDEYRATPRYQALLKRAGAMSAR